MSRRRASGRLRVGGLAGRLLVIGGIFTLSVLLELAGHAPYSERALTALYAVVLAGFLATLAQALLTGYGRDRDSAVLELGTDALLLPALLYSTGGARSVLGFLYLVWIVYAALRVGRRGATVSPLLATAGYAAIAVGGSLSILPPLELGDAVLPSEAFSLLGAHAVAFVLVAVLAYRLTREIDRGQAELYELGEIYRRIFDNVSTGILTVDRSGAITSFNAEAGRITGHGPEVIGTRLEALLPGIEEVVPVAVDRDPEEPEDRRGRLSRIQFDFDSRGRERLHLGLSHSLLRDSVGRVDGGVLIFQDLTHVTRIEEELRRSERLAAVGQLAAGLAHEIRNPLASLSGSIELLASELPARDRSARRLVAIVGRETERLNRLVSDFLVYARPGPARRERVDLKPLLEEVAELATRDGPVGAPIELELDGSLTVFGDPDQLRQVFWNLILNALQACDGGGSVVVSAERDLGPPLSATVAIEDTGAGIPNDLLERIFEPFFTTKAKGTGLGLATVHRVVEAHGGIATIRSDLGAGTCVRIELPLAE